MIAYFVVGDHALLWAFVSTVFALDLLPIGIWVLPDYVRRKATYQAESFFEMLRAMDCPPDRDLAVFARDLPSIDQTARETILGRNRTA